MEVDMASCPFRGPVPLHHLTAIWADNSPGEPYGKRGDPAELPHKPTPFIWCHQRHDPLALVVKVRHGLYLHLAAEDYGFKPDSPAPTSHVFAIISTRLQH